MSDKLYLAEEMMAYNTAEDSSNTDKRFLISGSKNVLIDRTKKVKSRSGYSRLGAANTSLTENRNAWTWKTSLGQNYPQRFYDDELEVYLGTIDAYAINAWTRIASSLSTSKRLRSINQISGGGSWYDATEGMDVQLMVIGDDKIYEWGGGVAVVKSIEATTITKQGTTTYAENHFYTDAGSTKVLICVRTGTEYTYTGGETSTKLTGIADTTGLKANDILIQKIVTNDNEPADGYSNDFIYNYQNQIIIGSESDARVYVSANDDYTDYSPSSPRVPGEGALLTLDSPTRGITSVGQYFIIGSGKSVMFRSEFQQLDVGSVLTETLNIKRLQVGVNQGFLNQESIVPIGNQVAYLTNEVALRIFNSPDELTGINPKNLSNPIKPDFDAEDWLDDNNIAEAFGIWYKNVLYFSVPEASHLYMLNFVENANGKLTRFWNPPQIMPVGPMSLIDLDDGDGDQLYGHSNGVPETYLLFDGASDGVYDDMEVSEKLPINAKAVFAYNNQKERGRLKNFDKYYVEGEITPNTTELLMTLDYDYDGASQSIEETIDGSDEDILEGFVEFNSLAQQSLAVNPLGGLLNPPSNARRFRIMFEEVREDFFELRTTFETNDVDLYWAIVAHGADYKLSKRRATNIRQ